MPPLPVPELSMGDSAEIRVKHRGLRCLGRVDAACNKFDNRLYVLKTDYRLETGLPIFRLPF